MLTVAVLGPVELRRDAAHLAVPAGKTTELLVRLALDAGVQVRAERLIEDLWSEQAVGVARNTLQAKVSNLRRALGDATLVTGGSAGYTLHVDPDGVDALQVLRLADECAALRASGDLEATVRTSTAALALFRGELLPDADWASAHRVRLEEARLELTEHQLAARIELGTSADVIGELEVLVAAEPLRERLWALLITALYRTGRQADALAAYRRVRQAFNDELGLDPGVELQDLERQILRHDTRLTGNLPGNLPGLSASLAGRAVDLVALEQVLAAERLVTVVGPAGVGKTRLAIEVARRAAPAGGAWLARLDTAPAAASLWTAVGEAFGISEASETTVLDRLRGLDLLLVLDNCEHLIDALPDAVDRMLATGPDLRVLATSQLPLGVDGEAVHPLEPLSITDSVELFSQRAAQHRRTFRADDQVVAVCRSLDGLPLAIELAAARVKVLSMPEIARRLEDRFTLLRDPTSRRPLRRRTLRAAIAWSYDLLFPDDQRGLWALACFAGSAPLAAAEDVLAALEVPRESALDVIGRLVDRSLAVLDHPGTVAGGDRYPLLDSVRAYGVERLAEAGLTDVARHAHAAWYAGAARHVRHGMRGPEQPELLAFVRRERADIDAALAWAGRHDPGLALRMTNGFGWAWVVLGAGADAAHRSRAALDAALSAADASAAAVAGVAADAPSAADASAAAADASAAAGVAVSTADRVDALRYAGWFEASGGNVARAVTDIEEAIALDPDDALSHLFLAFIYSQYGRPHDVLAALEGCRGTPDRWIEGAGRLLRAWAAIALGDVTTAKQACDDASRLLIPLRDDWIRAHTEAMLGGLAQAEQRLPDAVAHLTRAADAAHHLGFDAAGALHLANLGNAQQQSGDPTAAIATLERAVAGAAAAGDLRIVALARTRLARVHRALGDDHAARTYAYAAQQWYQQAGGGDGAALADVLLATLDGDAGRLTELLDTHGDDAEVRSLALDALALVPPPDDRLGPGGS